MSNLDQLDRTHHFIMKTIVKQGFAPHYTEIANEFGVSPDEGKKRLHDLMNFGLAGTWLHPDTDHIVAFAPFSTLPTQYRITVDGQQKWYGL